MKTAYYKNYSHHLDREMELKVYGHGGKPCLVFPSQNGRFYDYENNGMIEAAADFIKKGQIQFFCVDSIDEETWSDLEGDPRKRIEKHEQYYQYITEEVVPFIKKICRKNKKLLVTGNSMGAAHAVNFFLRRPDIFDSVIALSGLYSADFFFNGYYDDLVYLNSPLDYMRNLPLDHPYIQLYNESKIILCVGQGAWEDEMIQSTYALQQILKSKGIHAWIDFWGYDVDHDWPWWRVQLPYFLKSILKDDSK